MLMVVARGVTSILNVVLIILMLLSDATGEISLALLSDNIGNYTLLALEVKGHLLRLIFTARIGKHRLTLKLSHRVGDPHSMHHITIHVHGD